MTKNVQTALDALDVAILAKYQSDARSSAERIGAQVGLSTAAVHRRLKRLRATGVIEAEVAVLNPEAVGLPLTCVVAVNLERESDGEIERFGARMRSCTAVQQCFYVTGQADFILVVVVADMAAYEVFTRDQLLSDSNVRGFTSQVVLRRLKAGLALPLNQPS